MSSDSEDDVKLKQILEAADTTLLTNSMFQRKKETLLQSESTKSEQNTGEGIKKDVDIPKSQRYLLEHEQNTGTDFNLPESMQKYMAKKLSEILNQQYEFYDAANCDCSKKTKTKHKNRVKLLKGDECYVNSYEDFEYETKAPERKPEIKRRVIDEHIEHHIKDEDKLRMVAVDSNFILSGTDMEKWAKKKERKDKIFHYKLASSGVSHAIEDVNEFTALRHANKWNESKIKKFKKP